MKSLLYIHLFDDVLTSDENFTYNHVYGYARASHGVTSKRKVKGHPITGHEGPEVEQMYSSTIPSTSTLGGGWVVNATTWPLYSPEKTRYPLHRRLGEPQGPVCTVAESLSTTGIRSPDCPVCSESLYQISYPSPRRYFYWYYIRIMTHPPSVYNYSVQRWTNTGSLMALATKVCILTLITA